MKKDIAKKWVKALRSGKYKQGQSYLKQFNGRGEPNHCCLGVLCELYNDTMKKNHKKSLNTKIRHGYSGDYISFNKKEGELPRVVMKWSGVNDPIGRFGDLSNIGSLADMNDCGKTFKTISNFIEKNVENL